MDRSWLERGGGPRLYVTRDERRAAGAVGSLVQAGWSRRTILTARAPGGEPDAAWLRADLRAVELAHHWIFARAVLPSDDVLVLVDSADEDARASLAELRADPRVGVLPDGLPEGPEVEAAVPRLDEQEERALAHLDDPVALAVAAEHSAEQGWVVRPAALLERRERVLRQRGVPADDPVWGEGGWAWFRHPDCARGAAMLEDLVARADGYGWRWGPRLRLALGAIRLLFADASLSLGLLERAVVEHTSEPASDEELFARLALVIARDRTGQDSRPLLDEAIRRSGPHNSARIQAQMMDALGAARHRLGRIDDAITCFREAAALAGRANAPRFQALLETRALEVAITSARIRPDLDEIRHLRRRIAEVGGIRAATAVLQLQGDVARRMGALDEAAEAYTTLGRLQPLAPAALGFAMLALEREDWDAAATRLSEANQSREATGRRPTHLVEALSLPLLEARGELTRWEAALESWPLAVRGGHIDAARAAEAAARLAWRVGSPESGVRGARAARLAEQHWRALGRPELARAIHAAASAEHHADWPIPLGPLELIAPVARGGTAIIWRARHRELDLDVAVKVLTSEHARDPDAIDALDAEVRATARLRHPHVVAVRDLGRVDALAHALGGGSLPEGSPWVALEWVPGGTLARRRGSLPWEAVVAVLDQVLDALGHAHGHGLLHRDVKPENVMWAGLERDLPVVKLVDFGLSGVSGALVSGTPSYMAPEQFRGDGIGPWTDLYAVGCLAVALVQGRPPFSGANLTEFRRAHTREPVPPLRPQVDVPEGLGSWLEGLLAKDPAERFPSAGAARHALQQLGPAGSFHIKLNVEVTPEDNATIALLPLDDDEPAPLCSPAPVDHPLAPVPPWRARAIPPLPRPLGRALTGLGTPPLVGRAEAQGALWRALERGDPGARVVVGAPDLDVAALLAWFGREVRAAGCARVLEGRGSLPELYSAARDGGALVVILDEPDESGASLLRDPVVRSAPRLVVVGTRDAAEAAAWAAEGATSIRLDPLELEQLVVLARDLSPLPGDRALALAREAAGSPRALIDAVLGRTPRRRAAPVDREACLAQAHLLQDQPGPAAMAERVSLLVRAGRAAEGVDLLSDLAWAWPADPGELRLNELAREATDALAATGTRARDPRWGRLALVEARAALLGLDFSRVSEALDRARTTALPEADERIPFLRAVLLTHTRGWAAGIEALKAALATPVIAASPALALRYEILRATLERDPPALRAAGVQAEQLAEHRLAGDAWRGVARALAPTSPPAVIEEALSRSIDAYTRAASDYGLATALDERAVLRLREGDLPGFVADAERASRSLRGSLGLVSVGAWLNVAAARLLDGREQQAADGLAAAVALGVNRMESTARRAALMMLAFAADGPSEAWLQAVSAVEAARPSFDEPLPEQIRDLAIRHAEAAGWPDRAAWIRGLG